MFPSASVATLAIAVTALWIVLARQKREEVSTKRHIQRPDIPDYRSFKRRTTQQWPQSMTPIVTCALLLQSAYVPLNSLTHRLISWKLREEQDRPALVQSKVEQDFVARAQDLRACANNYPFTPTRIWQHAWEDINTDVMPNASNL